MPRRPSVSPFPADFPTVTAVELRRNFGLWMTKVAAAPVAVERHRRARMVLSSPEHYLQMANKAVADDNGPGSAVAAIPEHSSEAFLALDRDLRILAVNHVFEDMVGRTANKSIGLPVADLFPANVEPLLLGHLRHVLQSGTTVQFEAPSVLLEGRYYAFTVFPHAGGVAALIVNITTVRALRCEIEALRSLSGAVAQAPRAGHLKINLRGLIIAASPQFRTLTGRHPDDGALEFGDIASPDERGKLRDVVERVLSASGPALVPTVWIGPKGETVPLTLSLTPIWQGADVAGAAGFFQIAA